MATMLDPARFEWLTFDCYGTLIDWETGILRALRKLLDDAVAGTSDDDLLVRYADHEAVAESGAFKSYRTVLEEVAAAVAADLGAPVTRDAITAFAVSQADWPAFDDSASALARLKSRFRLAVISNIDDALFRASEAKLGAPFDAVVTAEQAGAYKPDLRVFAAAEARLGALRSRWLHVAQSHRHDIVPARTLGIASVWVDRRQGRGGGASGAIPNDSRPDLTVPDLASLADWAGV